MQQNLGNKILLNNSRIHTNIVGRFLVFACFFLLGSVAIAAHYNIQNSSTSVKASCNTKYQLFDDLHDHAFPFLPIDPVPNSDEEIPVPDEVEDGESLKEVKEYLSEECRKFHQLFLQETYASESLDKVINIQTTHLYNVILNRKTVPLFILHHAWKNYILS